MPIGNSRMTLMMAKLTMISEMATSKRVKAHRALTARLRPRAVPP
jgi:hypothetical protein